MQYDEESLLMLSGIQHIAFCERQWALIHIEKQWAENLRTVEGKHLHERVDNPFEFETRGDIITARAVPLVSYKLGLYGIADVIEYKRTNETGHEGIILKGHDGLWYPVPVEYKRGKPKNDDRDEVQLCAQAICLEEMNNIQIDCGYLYYGQTKHRSKVNFDEELRSRVESLSQRMHLLFEKGITPAETDNKYCNLCSLVDICVPKLNHKRKSVSKYLKKYLDYDLSKN